MNFHIRRKYRLEEMTRDIYEYAIKGQICQRGGFEAINSKNKFNETRNTDEL